MNTKYKYLSAKGKLPYNMTNDYMFRMVLQRDRETLTGLVCSLLHLSRNKVLDIAIETPLNPDKLSMKKSTSLICMFLSTTILS